MRVRLRNVAILIWIPSLAACGHSSDTPQPRSSDAVESPAAAPPTSLDVPPATAEAPPPIPSLVPLGPSWSVYYQYEAHLGGSAPDSLRRAYVDHEGTAVAHFKEPSGRRCSWQVGDARWDEAKRAELAAIVDAAHVWEWHVTDCSATAGAGDHAVQVLRVVGTGPTRTVWLPCGLERDDERAAAQRIVDALPDMRSEWPALRCETSPTLEPPNERSLEVAPPASPHS